MKRALLGLLALIVGMGVALVAAWPAAGAPGGITGAGTQTSELVTPIVCAPGTHKWCLPGPYTQTLAISQRTFVTIDVYLEHTGYFESNERSSFLSPLGDLLDCGPIPADDIDQAGDDGDDDSGLLYCGSVSGLYDRPLDLTVLHSGSGPSTGSHRQRYEITLTPDCHHYAFFPMVPNRHTGG